MGCVNGKTDINNKHPNIFNVLNVNEQGRAISPGKLEVTESDLVFHQRGMNPTRWPLRSLRKYGFDTDVFSFECGRRSPTGPGIYAFRCHKAEQLFNIVQHHITGVEENPALLNTLNQNIEFAILPMSAGPVVCHSGWFNSEESYVNPIQSTARNHNPVLSRPGSISSNGQVSPTTTSPPLVPLEVPSLEFNNNRRSSVIENNRSSPSYANITSETLVEAPCHVYMNTNAKPEAEDAHCYENVNKHHIESLQTLQQAAPKDERCKNTSIPNTPTVFQDVGYLAVREVNYAELELDPNKNDSVQTTSALTTQNVSSQKCYATIDFPKTVALLQSINPKVDLEEGSRKTRHNSTINSSSD